MTRDDSVAVIVPAFNAAATLARGLASLRDQTHLPTQVIVVDDGSTDGTAAVAEQNGATLLRQENRGPGVARNLGLEAATTEFVAFLDADDWYDPEKLARSIHTLRELDAQCVATDAWVVDGERLTGRKNSDRNVPVALTHEQLLLGNPVVCSTVVARREAVKLAGGFDSHADMIATEDYDLWLRMAHREPIAYLTDPLTFCRIGNLTLSDGSRFVRGIDRALDKVQAQHLGEAHFLNLVRHRRADARLNLAWVLLREGRFDDAQEWLSSAGKIKLSRKFWRIWWHCKLRRRPRA